MSIYADYFDIDPGYYPVINPNSIADKSNRWDNTFPHKTFIELLEQTERMLGRNTGKDKHGIWVEGAYGTGKSRIVWTLKSLLDCNEADFNSYFDKYEALKDKTDLRSKLLAHKKKGKILTVSKYGSSEIDSVKSLIVAVYESISSAARENGLTYRGEGSLRDKIADWLDEDEYRQDYFKSLINKPEYRYKGSFAGKTVRDIISALRNYEIEASNLTLDILDIAEAEGILTFSFDMDDLTKWIKDIINGNKLTALILIWDEFSDFFKNNRTRLSDFQKLAELAQSEPFYLVIVTHSAFSEESDQSFKVVSDRFNHKSIQLPDNIAFQLIKHAISIKPAARDQWKDLADDLNARLKSSRKAVAKETKLDESVFKDLLPIHPMAALLLKYISTAFASNQRSMFNFIKNETPDLHAFQWYINNHDPEDEDILTIDYLWDFFYEEGVDELSGRVGRSNLDYSISAILDTYNRYESQLFEDEEKRVLKIILMMQAISMKLAGQLEILRPTANNIKLAFEGVGYDDNYPIIIADGFVKKDILYKKPGTEEYAVASMSGDQVQIQRLKENLKKNTTTFNLLQDKPLSELLILTDSQKIRFKISIATKDKLKQVINKLSQEKKEYEIKALLLVARNQSEQNSLRNDLKSYQDAHPGHKFVFIDATESLMKTEEYERWLDNTAEAEYWRNKDGALAAEKDNRAGKCLKEWMDLIREGSFVLYSDKIKNGVNCENPDNLVSELEKIVHVRYPLSFDHIRVNQNLYLQRDLKKCAQNGITQMTGGICQPKDMEKLLNNIWTHKGNYWEEVQYQDEDISKLKIKVDKLINNELKKNVRISIRHIYTSLEKEGFMPCGLYALLLGFLLKEYAVGEYRYGVGQSGDDSGKMTQEKLADYISEYLKIVPNPSNKYKDKYIEIMTQNQKAFVDCSRKIFGFDDGLSVDQTVRQIRSKVTSWGYPLWCYKTIDQDNLGEYVDSLGDILNTEESLSGRAESFGKKVLARPEKSEQLQDLITAENGKIAFKEFLREFEDSIILQLAGEIGIEDVYGAAQQQISGSGTWLWDQKTGEEELHKLVIDYKIILLSKDLLQLYDIKKWQDCIDAWKESIKYVFIPSKQIALKHPEFTTLLNLLVEIVKNGSLSYESRPQFLEELQERKQWLLQLVNDSLSVFKDLNASLLGEFDEGDIKAIYNKLSNNSFLSSVHEYKESLKDVLNSFRKEQKNSKLRAKWKELADCESPRDWSSIHKTPIMVMVPEKERESARVLFNTLESKNPSDSDIKASLDYLSRTAWFKDKLKNEPAIEQAFHCFLTKQSKLLDNNNEVRVAIEKKLSIGAYDWFDNAQVQNMMKDLANDKYYQCGCEKVIKYLEKMTGEEAKAYLIELIKNNPLVGREIFEGDDL